MKQILCFGDSNTYGLIPGTKERYGWGTRWTSRLDVQVRPYQHRVIEEGLCGRTTVFDDKGRTGRKGTDILPLLLESHRPIDRVILMLGTNDCKAAFQSSPEEIGAGIQKLILQIRIENPKIKILLVSPILLADGVGEDGFDPEFDEKSVEVSKRLKNVYKKIAAHNGCDFLAASDYARPSRKDREHLEAEGHFRLADAIFKKIEGDLACSS